MNGLQRLFGDVRTSPRPLQLSVTAAAAAACQIETYNVVSAACDVVAVRTKSLMMSVASSTRAMARSNMSPRLLAFMSAGRAVVKRESAASYCNSTPVRCKQNKPPTKSSRQHAVPALWLWFPTTTLWHAGCVGKVHAARALLAALGVAHLLHKSTDRPVWLLLGVVLVVVFCRVGNRGRHRWCLRESLGQVGLTAGGGGLQAAMQCGSWCS